MESDIHTKLDAEIKFLKEELKNKDDKIESLQEHILSLETEPLQSKKRRLDSTGQVAMNEEWIKETYNKEIEIERLTKENECLKSELLIQKKLPTTACHQQVKPTVSDKNTEAKQMLPDTTIPKVESLFQDMKRDMDNQMVEMKEFIQKSIDGNQKTIDEKSKKLEALIADKISTPNTAAGLTSFASIVSGKPSTPASNAADFRTLMRTTRNEEITEDKEKERRKRNIIVHGCRSSDESKTKDFIDTLFKDIGAESIVAKAINRIGKVEQSKRPIIVEFQSEQDKDKIMLSLPNLKGKTEYKGTSITDDYTVAERELINEYRREAKELNAKNETREYVFVVRGTPKNGLYHKKIKKTITVMSTNMDQ
jgi:hypothetical protein